MLTKIQILKVTEEEEESEENSDNDQDSSDETTMTMKYQHLSPALEDKQEQELVKEEVFKHEVDQPLLSEKDQAARETELEVKWRHEDSEPVIPPFTGTPGLKVDLPVEPNIDFCVSVSY